MDLCHRGIEVTGSKGYEILGMRLDRSESGQVCEDVCSATSGWREKQCRSATEKSVFWGECREGGRQPRGWDEIGFFPEGALYVIGVHTLSLSPLTRGIPLPVHARASPQHIDGILRGQLCSRARILDERDCHVSVTRFPSLPNNVSASHRSSP